jgi:hypothetical protein
VDDIREHPARSARVDRIGRHDGRSKFIDGASIRSKALSTIVLSAGSSLTGAGTVMLGVLLPTLSQQQGLRDDRAGLLHSLHFFASGPGAIVTGLHCIRSLEIGYGIQAALGALVFGGPKVAYAAGLAMAALNWLIFRSPQKANFGSQGVIKTSKDNRVSIHNSAGINAPGRLPVRACLNGR